MGQSPESRTLRFDIEAQFDSADATAATKDVLLVYLVDPADRSRTILDRGPGTALFALSSAGAEYPPGLVRYNGATVEIDVTRLGGFTEGRLVFQLVGGDDDTGSQTTIKAIESIAGQSASSMLRFPNNTSLAEVDGPRDLTPLALTDTVDVELNNIRLSPQGRYSAELRLRNRGEALGRTLLAAFPNLPQGVTLLNPSGVTPQGSPYLNLTGAVADGGLGTRSTTNPVLVELDNPGLVPFALRPQVFSGGANQPPILEAVGPLPFRWGKPWTYSLQPRISTATS